MKAARSPHETAPTPPSWEDIMQAKERLQKVIHRTPLVHSTLLSRMAGCELYLKAENLQRGGAYKIRGAYNKAASLPPEAREKGIIAFSSGNHAQGAALAARELGCPAVVVMPENVSPVKKQAVESYGAQVVLAGTTTADREREARRLAREHGYAVIPAYADPQVIAGQATVALEILEDLPHVDILVVPIGGGGLISGCALAAKTLRPQVRVIGVEPERAADAYESFRRGQLTKIDSSDTIADGLRALHVGEINWEIIRRYVDDIVLVSEEEIKEAMALLLTRTKLLAEPSGAVTTAAVLQGRVGASAGQKVAAVISGGNVDLSTLAALVAAS